MRSLQLRDVCNLITDGTHYTPPDIGAGVPFLTVKDIDDQGSLDFDGCSKIAEAEFAKAAAGNSAPMFGDVLFSKDGTVGKVSVVREKKDFAVLSSIAILRPNAEVVDSEYLGHVLRSPDTLNQALKKKTGSAIRRIILSDLKSVRLPVPGLTEQRRLAAILEKADALRAKRREAIAKLDELLQAVFLDMFGGSRDWPSVAVGDICEVKGGKRLPKGEDYATGTTPFRYIRVSDIEPGRILEDQLKYLKPEVQEKIKRYVVSDGDIVITIAGTIGVVAPVGLALCGANLTENAAKLVPIEGSDYESEYLSFALGMPDAQAQIQAQTGQVTIGKLALFRIEKITVPMPPRAFQKKFVLAKKAIEARRSDMAESLVALEEMFRTLQHSAFAGAL